MCSAPSSVSACAVLAASVAAAIATGTSLSGQVHREYWPLVERELATGLFGRPEVTDAPFAAEAVTTWTPPPSSGIAAHRVTTRLYRARDGRARVEHTFAGQAGSAAQEIYVLADPAAGETWRLDPPTQTASRSSRGFAAMKTPSLAELVIPVSSRCAIRFMRPQTMQLSREGTYAEEDLGQRQLAGVAAVGRRFTATLQWPVTSPAREMTDERWVSRDLRLVLRSRSDDPEIGTVEHAVTRLVLTEPPAALFTAPVDSPPGPLDWPYTWENPHALMTWRRGVAPCDLSARP